MNGGGRWVKVGGSERCKIRRKRVKKERVLPNKMSNSNIYINVSTQLK